MNRFLNNTPILKIVDLEKDFIICIDSCTKGIIGVLMQDENIICYESRKLKEHEKNYATYDLELATIVHALKVWKNYAMERKFKIRIDHMSLKCLFD